MQLLRSPWSEAFNDFGRAIRSEAILVAPFIRAEPLAKLEALLNPIHPPRIDLITNLAADSLFRGMVDTEAITKFAEDLSSKVAATVTVRDLRGLHAKTYVADQNLAIVTSGNLTQASLNTNSEYGVKVTKPELVREIIDDIWAYSSLSTVIPLSLLGQITERTRQAREMAEFRTAEDQAVRYLQQDLDSILSGLKAQMGDDEPDGLDSGSMLGDLPRQVFGRTILNVLQVRGQISTDEMYHIIRELHPDLCDDSILRISSTGVQYKEPLWRYQVRVAQKRHREGGRIRLVDRKWQLVK